MTSLGSDTLEVLCAEGISKTFGTVIANHDVSLTLRRAEVTALVGENGAGKSTLLGVLSGRLTPDRGTISVRGHPLPLGSPSLAAQRGIAAVYQDMMLVPAMTGLENIALALGTAVSGGLRRLLYDVQSEFSFSAPLEQPAGGLDPSARQRIQILRALAQRPSVLLLDEPTSVLPPTEVAPLLNRIRELANAGLAVLLITHRLQEAYTASDRLTIMRAGRVAGEYTHAQIPSFGELTKMLVGDDNDRPTPPHAPVSETKLGLAAHNITVRDERGHEVVRSVTLDVEAGEVLGIGGIDGNGQAELLESLAGLRRVRQGAIYFGTEDVTSVPYAQRRKLGVQHVSGDRGRHEVIPTFTIADHFRCFGWRGSLDSLSAILEYFDVRPAAPGVRVDTLSGGNQQKVTVARACVRGAKVLLLSYPTQGLDVRAVRILKKILAEQAAAGVAICVSGSDLTELLDLADRVAIMARGEVVGQQRRASFDLDQLGAWCLFGSRYPAQETAVV